MDHIHLNHRSHAHTHKPYIMCNARQDTMEETTAHLIILSVGHPIIEALKLVQWEHFLGTTRSTFSTPPITEAGKMLHRDDILLRTFPLANTIFLPLATTTRSTKATTS